MIDIDNVHELKARIKVIGVGGGGNNAVDRMVADGIENIEFISANTDNKALAKSKAATRIQLGEKLTRGLGAGGKPETGRRSAEETRDVLANAIDNTDLLFITAGMGGGTGTGAAPVIAAIAREMGILTVGVVTKPFSFEGGPRMRNAIAGINELRKSVDTLVIIPNERLLSIVGDDVSLVDAFRRADEVLHQGVIGISGVILDDGLVNLDFADVRTVMEDQGVAHMGIGRASGKGKIETAIKEAINSPLLETSISGAKAVIISFTGDNSMGLKDLSAAANFVGSALDPDAEVMFGATIDDSLKDEVRVTVVATGLNEEAALSAGASANRRPADPYANQNRDDHPPDIQEAMEEREELKPIRESNFRLINEDITPPFLRDWKKRSDR
ncbi:MAG: cell division protein FtsZ [Defluviitaleaceae bacterium]|nr:cell division protein FtsZ [Defluviitaleaceae bacterium]MCL2264048.1 cell division protein FtsZ [Defluviitaleaceae bacterium]